MKKTLLVCISALSGVASLLAQIPNNSFESWKTAAETLPENWDIYGTPVKTSGQSGGSAIKLSNNSATSELSFATQMHIDTSLFYRPIFAYSGNPDSVTVVFKPNLGQDTAYFQIGFTASGKAIPVVMAEFFLTGNSNQWTTRTFPFRYTQPTPSLVADSGYVVITSADEVFGPLSSGSIEIDDITFKFQNNSAAPNIPNHSFENWHSYAVQHPEGWGTTALFMQKQGLFLNENNQTNDPYQGSTALVLRGLTIPNPATNSTDTLPGQAITLRDATNPDPANTDIFTPSFPVSARYTSIRGYLKSNLGVGDLAVAWVHFFDADSVVGTAIYIDGNDHSSYIEFAEDIAWDSAFTGTPDSATIMLMVTDSALFGLNDLSSWAYFDNLRFDNWNSKVQPNDNRLRAGIFPNPSQGNTTLKASFTTHTAYSIQLFSSDGKAVWQTDGFATTDKNYIPLPLTQLCKGVYTLRVQNNGKQYTEKILLTQ